MTQAMESLARLDGQVAVVTGAGRGIGRAHASALARLGATVVVNDLGTSLRGEGADAAVAAAVVGEIMANGGRAEADCRNIASVDGGRSLVDDVVARFGRIDIVVNNAGFAGGGGTIAQLDEAGLDALYDVHVRAALGTMTAAFTHMRVQGYGRIVNTVSEASLDTRFIASLGYAMAKAALWSATLVGAMEGAPHGITVNAISPGARTRMSADVLDRGFRDGASAALDLSPNHVARVVAYLVGPDAGDITGRIIHAAAGSVREYTTRRYADTELVTRLRNALGQ